jgi:hypothetical protein
MSTELPSLVIFTATDHGMYRSIPVLPTTAAVPFDVHSGEVPVGTLLDQGAGTPLRICVEKSNEQ